MTHWYALHAKPHKERQVCRFLESEGVEVYLPLIPVGRRGQYRFVPFFSCYLFARLGGAAALSSVRWTPGLRRIVSFDGHPAKVPDEVINDIQRRLARMLEAGQTTYPFQRGDRVVLRKGPLADLEAVFEKRLSSRHRARILVDCLGRWTRCEVEVDSLKRVY
jgi:transcriptional antiterminator RfaH